MAEEGNKKTIWATLSAAGAGGLTLFVTQCTDIFKHSMTLDAQMAASAPAAQDTSGTEEAAATDDQDIGGAAAAPAYAFAQSPDNHNREVRIVNRTGLAINGIYVAPEGAANWGSYNFLGAAVIEDTASAPVILDIGNDVCVLDLHFTLAGQDGNETVERTSVDVCNTPELEVARG